ncbi:MAG: TonB family protein [Pseudomonadota bacterium]|nr:TonB family protein [Pseudomonadota bacterium]
MKSELLAALFETTLAMTLMLAIVLPLRLAMRHSLGTVAAYRLWMSIPLVMAASLLPAWTPLRNAALSSNTLATVKVMSAAAQSRAPGADGQTLMVLGWLIGVVLMAVLLTRQQRRFVRSLGSLQAIAHGVYRASAASAVPALIGALPPRIVVPDAFEQRYSPLQQELILLHERTHMRCGDAQINALIAALRCLFWFNPLLHYAAVRIRIDQELACDAMVLRQRPDARRTYAEAMLNTQLADTGLPVGCQWQSSHPLKERIYMMTTPLPSRLRRRIGNVLISAVLGTSVALAWASQSPMPASTGIADREAAFAQASPPRYPEVAARDGISGNVMLSIVIGSDGKPSTINIVQSQPPGVFDVAASAAAAKWTFQPAIENGVAIASEVLVPITFSSDGETPAPATTPVPRVLDTLQVEAPKN